MSAEQGGAGIEVVFWPDEEGLLAVLEVERDETKVALHTFVDGEGSKTSYYLDREAAITLATRLLGAVILR